MAVNFTFVTSVPFVSTRQRHHGDPCRLIRTIETLSNLTVNTCYLYAELLMRPTHGHLALPVEAISLPFSSRPGVKSLKALYRI